MSRFPIILIFLFNSLSVICGYSNSFTINSEFLNNDSSKIEDSKKEKRIQIKPKISGYVNYNFNFFQTDNPNIDTIIPYQFNQPRHFINGAVQTTIKDIPISAKFVYDPNLPQQDQFKVNFSFESEKFNSNLKKKYEDQKKNYASYQDSLIQNKFDNSIKKQLAENKIQELKKSLDSYEIKDSIHLNSMPPHKNINDSVPITLPDSSKYSDRSKYTDSLKTDFDFNVDSNYTQNGMDSSQIKKDSIQKEIEQLQKQIDQYDQNINKVSNAFNNDSLIHKNQRRFEMNKSLNMDTLDYKKHLTQTEKLLSSVKTFQIGTISPHFSKLSTYRANLTGINLAFKPSKKVNIHTFAGWQSNYSYTNIKKAIKSGGLKLSYDFLSTLKLSGSVVHNQRDQQVFGESYISEISNSIFSFGIQTLSLKNIEIGSTIDVSKISTEDNLTHKKISDFGFSNYANIQFPETKSRLRLEINYIPENFRNYLTPYQIPSNTEYKASYSQLLVKSKLTSRISVLHRNIHKSKTFTKNDFTNITWDIRTRWVRYPNLFVNIINNTNTYITHENKQLNSNSIQYQVGINWYHKIKTTKIFSEFAYQSRSISNITSSYQTHRYRLQFRLKNKKLEYHLNALYSKSIYNSSEISNQLQFNVAKKLKLGFITRWNQILNQNKFTNGVKASMNYKKMMFKAEYLISSYQYSPQLNHIINAQLTYKF